jgi:16S rRNA (uracil1498-N3)-methyltransferase
MRIPRIYTNQPLAAETTVTLDEAPSRHLVQVLRLRPGAHLRLFNGDGRDYQGELRSATKQGLEVTLTKASGLEPEPAVQFILGQGISRGERMDYVIQKAVELGVSTIVPLFAERTVVKLKGEKLELRVDHWRKVMIAACEQSGRRRLPQMETPLELEAWLSGLGSDTKLVLDPQAQQGLQDLPPPSGSVQLLIGPEGGLCQEELQLAQRCGFTGVRLGPRILRTETAPVAALAALQALWGDFR